MISVVFRYFTVLMQFFFGSATTGGEKKEREREKESKKEKKGAFMYSIFGLLLNGTIEATNYNTRLESFLIIAIEKRLSFSDNKKKERAK